MECARCGCKDIAMFYHGSRGWYCRRCVMFGNVSLPENNSRLIDSEYQLGFELTDMQKQISGQLTRLVEQGKSVLLEAVCGAGKTEIIFEMVSRQLAMGRKVGFSIARRQVVLEIADRLSQAITGIKVVAVCHGYTNDVIGDLVVCTTHQLFRYSHYFDVLIIDEPDAFPFKGNETLKGIANNACDGSMVYLTATPDRELKEMAENGQLEYLYLSRRPHGHDLCVPEVVYGGKVALAIRGLLWLKKEREQERKVIIFVPSRKTGMLMHGIMQHFCSCCHIDSTSEDRDQTIIDFRNGKYDICISTSVLERGITIANVQVLVWMADNQVFDEASLTQISGRVGRNRNHPSGDCLFLCMKKEKSVDQCVESIRRANHG